MLRTFLIAFIMIVHHNKILSQCWKDIYCGEDFTLAISDDNKCWAWGDNYINQFSNGDFFKSFNPEMIGEFVGWVKDSQDKIAIVKNENGEFFIYNKAFFLGDHDVKSKEWKYISRKGDFTIGIKKDGTLWSWGDNAFGSLGDGTKVNSQVPKRIGKDKDWLSISAGWRHTLALKKDGSLWSWGNNGYGELGYKGILSQLIPRQIEGDDLVGWISLDAATSSFGIKKDGSLWAWGYNGNGELGIGNKLSSNGPRQIGQEKGWKKISAGRSHVAAIKNNGTLWIWGYNSHGQLGVWNLTEAMTPVEVLCPK